MKSNKIKILYIAGWGRSGSTILDTTLGQVKGLFSAGELNRIWDHGLRDGGLCACGLQVKECQVWKAVLTDAFDNWREMDIESMIAYRDKISGTRFFPLWILLSDSYIKSKLDHNYLQAVERLYQSIQENTRCEVVVDSSKFPTYGKLLKLLPSLQVYLLHLVRDPRAVAYSWQRKKAIPDNLTYFRQRSAIQSSLFWLTWNDGVERLWRKEKDKYMRIRYEDFVSKPTEAVEKITRFLELDTNVPFLQPGNKEYVKKINGHSLSGNPVRFQRGDVKLKEDNEWMSLIKPKDRILVTLITWPLLKRYGYRTRI